MNSLQPQNWPSTNEDIIVRDIIDQVGNIIVPGAVFSRKETWMLRGVFGKLSQLPGVETIIKLPSFTINYRRAGLHEIHKCEHCEWTIDFKTYYHKKNNLVLITTECQLPIQMHVQPSTTTADAICYSRTTTDPKAELLFSAESCIEGVSTRACFLFTPPFKPEQGDVHFFLSRTDMPVFLRPPFPNLYGDARICQDGNEANRPLLPTVDELTNSPQMAWGRFMKHFLDVTWGNHLLPDQTGDRTATATTATNCYPTWINKAPISTYLPLTLSQAVELVTITINTNTDDQ